ncbi:AraC family transcriptional regulator [Paenibacillus sp. 598K]|uniref:AraC family transcriptional regulator n=1 Tax=Paenibacillus sp. 598K TaxID=1117987 RepID=UPI000FFAE470|nr:AraC family transcriptional regulator [Paenibacillus sp. 598K]GBF74098.1 AraC family transcriptional regulator [Paenibacillus sp. 598K]
MKLLRKNLFFAEHTFRKWFVSSMCVILIFIVIGLLLYLIALHTTEKTVVMAQRQAAEQTKGLIDLKLLDIKKDVSALAFNDRLLSASFITKPLDNVDYYNLHQAREELRGLYLYGNVRDSYVYFAGCDCFISAYQLKADDTDTFTERQFGLKRRAWADFASRQTTSGFAVLQDRVYFLSPLSRNGQREAASLAIVELDVDDLAELLFSVPATSDSYSYIIASDGELIAASGHPPPAAYGYGELDPGENYIDNTVVTSQHMTEANWEYISVAPIDQYLKEVYDLRLVLYGYLGISVILAACIVYYETRRRYRPVLTLSRNVALQHNRDIFQDLQETIQTVVANNTRLTSLLKQDQELLLNQKFTDMLREHAKPEKEQPLFQENFARPFRQGMVCVVHVEAIGAKLADLSAQEQENILLLCLNNIGKELLGAQYACYFWKYVDITGVIWSDTIDDTTTARYITTILEQTRASIKRYFDVDLQLALSRLSYASSTLASSYLQARESRDYARMTGKSGVIPFDESYTQLPPAWHHMDIIRAEQDFMSYMMERNYEMAKTKLEVITGYYEYTDGASIQLLQCRMFGLINLVLNAIEIKKTPLEEQFYLDMNPVQRLLGASTIQSLKLEIMRIIEAMITRYDEKEPSTEQKLEVVDRYIELHYTDPSLSVQQLADHVHLSISHLSQVYKQHKGTGVLEVINARRIERVKELLRENTDMTLTQIAEKSGYSNLQTMMRVFKKLEHQTPGQYRAKQ